MGFSLKSIFGSLICEVGFFPITFNSMGRLFAFPVLRNKAMAYGLWSTGSGSGSCDNNALIRGNAGKGSMFNILRG